jgi:hypothetical protein
MTPQEQLVTRIVQNQLGPPNDLARMLDVFAYHCFTIATDPTPHTLHFWGNVRAHVEPETINGSTNFRINSTRVGNVHGALETYTALCAPAFENVNQPQN